MANNDLNTPYIDRVYSALSENLDGFDKTPEQFMTAMKNPEYVQKAHAALSQTIDGFSKPLEHFHAALSGGAAPRDNTKSINPVIPTSNNPQAINLSKKAVSNNIQAQQIDKYYNPEYKPNITSGDSKLDLLYHNQWLMNIPGVGDYIKDQAYKEAKNSAGFAVKNKESATEYAKNQSKGKIYGGQLTGDKPSGVNLIDQYFGKINLPSSKYKPASDYLTFLPSVSVKGEFDKSKNPDIKDVLNEISMTDKEKNDLYQSGKPIFRHFDQSSALTTKLNLDLGGHKVGVGYDKEKKLPFVSLSDAWDFNPESYGKKYADYGNAIDNGLPTARNDDAPYIQAALMAKAGKPFKVYDRFYFDPKTNSYIPDSKINVNKKR